MSLLQVNELRIAYPGEERPAVDGLSFDLEKGESLGIVGESGAGKSQMALALSGLLPANAKVSGSIIVNEQEILGAGKRALRQYRSNTVSIIFQDPATALNPYVSIGEQLRLVVVDHKIARGRHAKTVCIELLARVGLPEPERQYRSYPHQLSGGMRQRALIAMSLVGNPELIIADEPTTALDVTVQAQILRLLNELRQDLGTALIMITHDLGVIAQCCENVLVMDGGRMVESGGRVEVFANPKEAYTARLIDAVPHFESIPASSKKIEDDPVIDVQDMRVCYQDRRRGRKDDVVAVQAMSLTLNAGETIAIVGESGSGKTSLARAIAGLIISDGRVLFLGLPLAPLVEGRPLSVRHQLQMVFQDPVSSLNPAMRVGNILGESILMHEPSTKSLAAETMLLLERVGLPGHIAQRHPHELSGGQAQRVAIARALALYPRVLICDEALAALDGTVRSEIIDLLKTEQRKSGLSLMMITHDLGVVREISDRVIVMYKGEVCEEASSEQLFNNPQHPYTKALLAAVPTLDGVSNRYS